MMSEKSDDDICLRYVDELDAALFYGLSVFYDCRFDRWRHTPVSRHCLRHLSVSRRRTVYAYDADAAFMLDVLVLPSCVVCYLFA